MVVSKQLGFASESACNLYYFVYFLNPADVCNLACVFSYGTLILVAERPFTTLRNPSDLINTLDVDELVKLSILFLPKELEIIIYYNIPQHLLLSNLINIY